MSTNEDWTQKCPTWVQVKNWIREQLRLGLPAEEAAWKAYEHFARPYHIDALRRIARELE